MAETLEAQLSRRSNAHHATLNSMNPVRWMEGKALFRWNHHDCEGNSLHAAAINEDVDKVKEILEQEPTLATSRFTYTDNLDGVMQTCSGEAIHIAVTRSSRALVHHLVQARASVESKLIENNYPICDVLHCAVWREGRGGVPKIVKWLLEAKAPPTKNAEGRYPLHVAFEKGGRAEEFIPMLVEDMQERGLLEEAEKPGGSVKTPLELGIDSHRISCEKMAKFATLSTTSLNIFLTQELGCLPAFFDRLATEEHHLTAADISNVVDVRELCRCIDELPEAAVSLLSVTTITPEVQNVGWHPLPSRMSFAPRDAADKLRLLFNPMRKIYNIYPRAKSWDFDSRSFFHPPWQNELLGNYGQPIFDVEIQVCLIPELICPMFLQSLARVDNDAIFDQPIVRACLNSVWWGGAYRLDMFRLMITTIGLLLLIVAQQQESGIQAEELGQERLLAQFGGAPFPGLRPPLNSMDASVKWFTPDVLKEFLAAVGLVDVLHELLGLVRYKKDLRGSFASALYFLRYTAILRAALSISVFHSSSIYAHTALIAIYWCQTLEIASFEMLMREILPITRLVWSLVPSLVVCVIAMCAFTHANWVLHDEHIWPDVVYDSFQLLITAALPPPDSRSLDLIFAYGVVLCFSIFFLNIFIGVLSEVYSAEKEKVELTFQKKKCHESLHFLTRAQVIPGRVLGSTSARVIGNIAIVLLVLWLLSRSLLDVSTFCSLSILTMLLLLSGFCCYQDTKDIWTDSSNCNERRFMWVACPIKEEVQTPIQNMQGQVEELKAVVDKLQILLRQKLFVHHVPSQLSQIEMTY